MLSEADAKYFRFVERDPWWVRAIIIILPFTFVFSALLQLNAAAQFANGAELGLWDVIRGWYEMPEVKAYHPFEAAAIKRVESAFGMVLLALAFAGLSSVTTIARAREKRIASLLREKGLLENQDA